jgi:hypothetical protein
MESNWTASSLSFYCRKVPAVPIKYDGRRAPPPALKLSRTDTSVIELRLLGRPVRSLVTISSLIIATGSSSYSVAPFGQLTL